MNKAIHEAAGSCLFSETKKLYSFSLYPFFPPTLLITSHLYWTRYNIAELGRAYPVQLPSESPLRQSEDVLFVIHVLPPNMDPESPEGITVSRSLICTSAGLLVY